MDEGKTASRAWTRQQTRLGQRAALPVVILRLLGTALAVAQVWCVAAVLSDGLGGQGRPLAPLVAFGGLALIRAALGALSERFAARAGAHARRRLRSDALSRLLAAGPALLRRSHSAELAAVVVDRIEALDGLFARWVPAAILAWSGPFVVLLAAAIWADWRAALVLAIAGLFVPVAMAVAGIGAAAASRRQFLALARLQARFLDRVRGIATIVLAGRAEGEAAALARAADELRARTMRVLRVAFLSSAALDCAAAAALVFLAIHYAGALRTGQAPVRTALFALLLVPEFFAPLRGFSAAYQDRLHATGAAEQLATLPQAAPAPLPAPAVRTVQARGVSVAFEDVRLTWDAARGPALDGLSFRLAAGETLILAGPSGAGKSTVLEILLGFVRPDAGRVTLNGADIASVVPASLARMTAWIGQRPLLFAGSIAENIRFARPDASGEEINRAAAAARVADFAAALPQGLDTPVSEGGFGLSGGQAQRVAIARAFLKNAPLLLLDEPTAHLDPATEAEVLESLRRLAIGHTVILATHSTAAHAFGGRRLDLRDGRALAARAA